MIALLLEDIALNTAEVDNTTNQAGEILATDLRRLSLILNLKTHQTLSLKSGTKK